MASQLAEQLGVIRQTMPEAGAGLAAGGKNYFALRQAREESAARADEAAATAEQRKFENTLAMRRDARAEQTVGLQADKAERETREAELEDLAKRASAARTPALWKQAQDSGFLPKELGFENREPIVMSALTVKAQKDLENQNRDYALREKEYQRKLAQGGDGEGGGGYFGTVIYTQGPEGLRAYQPSRSGQVKALQFPEGEVPTATPGQQPEFKGAQAFATESGKARAETSGELREREAGMPRLMSLVDELSDLGKKATYTRTGKALDIARKEAGLAPRESAVARREYIAKVDNEILPLLRQTFGAQFTQKEGESLKTTLGDPDATPAEKDAVLRAFIKAKQEQIATLQRRVSSPSGGSTASPGGGAAPEVLDWNDLP